MRQHAGQFGLVLHLRQRAGGDQHIAVGRRIGIHHRRIDHRENAPAGLPKAKR